MSWQSATTLKVQAVDNCTSFTIWSLGISLLLSDPFTDSLSGYSDFSRIIRLVYTILTRYFELINVWA